MNLWIRDESNPRWCWQIMTSTRPENGEQRVCIAMSSLIEGGQYIATNHHLLPATAIALADALVQACAQLADERAVKATPSTEVAS